MKREALRVLRKQTGIMRQMQQVQFTLRKMQSFLSASMFRPRFWALFVTMVVLFSVVGPFGTFDRLDLIDRAIYWSVTMIGSWLIAMITIAFFEAVFRERLPITATIFIGCVMASAPIALFLDLVIPWFLALPNTLNFWYFLAYVLPISLAFGLIIYLVESAGYEAKAHSQNDMDPAYENFISKIPVNKRGVIQHMSMQDHYVSITTEKGTELVLMRMADAVAALPADLGLQIHRSHWVAKSAVTGSRRDNGKQIVVTKDGNQFPVSRTHMKAAKEAGLLI